MFLEHNRNLVSVLRCSRFCPYSLYIVELEEKSLRQLDAGSSRHFVPKGKLTFEFILLLTFVNLRFLDCKH